MSVALPARIVRPASELSRFLVAYLALLAYVLAAKVVITSHPAIVAHPAQAAAFDWPYLVTPSARAPPAG